MTERTIERACEICGETFAVIPSRIGHGRGKHCSPACQYEARRRQPKVAVSLICIGCGSRFERAPSQLKRGGGKFCTRACRDRHWKGSVTPNWQNGSGVYKRGPHWFSTRRRILARDGHSCVQCGSKNRPHVHHIIPFRMFDSADEANHDSNLITLCPPCHRKEDAQHKWVKFESGVLWLPAGGAAWQLARERGLI